MIGSGVKAKCKNCGCEAPAEQFKLHFALRQMVCSNCFSGRNKKEEVKKEKAAEKPRSAGWDAEDEYLDKLAKVRREENQAQFSKIAGTEQVRCTCFNCKYVFRYDPFRKSPKTCPYCNNDIPKMKTFNLL